MQLNKIVFLSIALFGHAFAADVELAGTIDHNIQPSGKKQFAVPYKIKLMNMKLSSKASDALKLKTRIAHQEPIVTATPYVPSSKQLGMNDVPVLNQGPYGTCVTFANTAAVDAALGKGDYISQLCLLQLGNYEQEFAYRMSGWEGSFSRNILSRLQDHGIISKENEQTEGCGDLKEYPQNFGPIPDSAISFDDYHQRSKSLEQHGISWSPILDLYKGLITADLDSKAVIDDIKKAINKNRRVTISSFLPAIDMGIAGAVGKHHAENDSWVLSTVIERELYLSPSNFAAHALVVTGYDDNAVAVDDSGREHRGLFTLRNSWGENLGDKGDFYMSYDYFRVLGLEAQQIIYDPFFSGDEDSDDEEDEE